MISLSFGVMIFMNLSCKKKGKFDLRSNRRFLREGDKFARDIYLYLINMENRYLQIL
jgi:hypothetical protein